MVNVKEAWMTPEEIADSRLPDRVQYSDWQEDYSFNAIPFKKTRAMKLGQWGAVLESVTENWEWRTEVRFRLETWNVPAISIPYIIEPLRFIAGDEGPSAVSEATFAVRDTQPQTVARKVPEYRRVEMLVN